MDKNISVFCSSLNTLAPLHFAVTEDVGRLLSELKFRVYYGGTDQGLMGSLATGVKKNGGELVGILPKSEYFSDKASKGLNHLVEVETLSDRKNKLIEASTVCLVLPGGIGTLDELFDVLALNSVSREKKTILLYNELKFFDPLLDMLDLYTEQGFINAEHLSILKEIKSLDHLKDFLEGL